MATDPESDDVERMFAGRIWAEQVDPECTCHWGPAAIGHGFWMAQRDPICSIHFERDVGIWES